MCVIHATGEARATASSEAIARTTGAVTPPLPLRRPPAPHPDIPTPPHARPRRQPAARRPPHRRLARRLAQPPRRWKNSKAESPLTADRISLSADWHELAPQKAQQFGRKAKAPTEWKRTGPTFEERPSLQGKISVCRERARGVPPSVFGRKAVLHVFRGSCRNDLARHSDGAIKKEKTDLPRK